MVAKTQEKQVKTTEKMSEARPLESVTTEREMDRLFDNFLSRNWLSPFNRDWSGRHFFQTPFETKLPHVDIIDHENELVIRSEVPGVDKKDLEVTLTDNTITIKGHSHHEEEEEKDEYYRQEILHGAFSRTLRLPCDINNEDIKSSFKDGVLELVAPKAKAVKRHKITF